MKKLIMLVSDDRGEWEEKYDDSDFGSQDPHEWARETVERFNASLRPHELPRKVEQTEVIDLDDVVQHRWVKMSLSTQYFRGHMVDYHRCEICGVTGKRFGLSSTIKRDSKFRAKVYDRCDTALAHIKKKGE